MPRTELHNQEKAPRAAGFTLIEILVSISIIVLLIGITFPALSAIFKTAEARRLSSMLAGLVAASEEYQVVTDGTIDHTQNRFPSRPGEVIEARDRADNNTIQLFVYEAGKVPTAAKLLAVAAKDSLRLSNGTDSAVIGDLGQIADPSQIEVLDSFGNPIRYAAYVNKRDTFTGDDYLPAHPRPFFASAGPDGLWGEVNGSGEPDEAAADNVYSFETQ